ncbi:jg14542 [Pararge aegeria aegeria]|uniref:Jg14542 protein n=1 Tax=Pararge aegeria aegeria TaxID=348720 RepID=A0A8S4RDV0_9NEOP|nr:jg14542 [Pararge aegeria aegeria]
MAGVTRREMHYCHYVLQTADNSGQASTVSPGAEEDKEYQKNYDKISAYETYCIELEVLTQHSEEQG